jgi:hypothetical protein
MRIRVSELFEEPLSATDAIELQNDTVIDSEKIRQLVLSKISDTTTNEEPSRPQVKGKRARYRTHRQKRITIGIALIALSVVLLCGFTYALTTGLLTVKDNAGHEVMRVKSPEPSDTIPAEQQELEDRIKKTIHDQLQQGEAALILLGQGNIDAVKKHEWPKKYLSTYRGQNYSSTQDISARLIGHLSGLKKLGNQIMDAKLTTVEMVPYLGTPTAVPLDKWVETTDTASGHPYAYYKFNADERAYLDDGVITLTYQNEDSTFKLMGFAGDFTSLTVYDQNPSAERIHEVGGIPIYHIEGQDLIWRQPVKGGGELDYMLKSDADIKKQLDFAETVIKATSEER